MRYTPTVCVRFYRWQQEEHLPADMCVFNVCLCVCMRLFVHVCRSLWARFFGVCGFVRMCVCVAVCTPCANVVKAGGNPIGYDLCWQVLRAIVITPV